MQCAKSIKSYYTYPNLTHIEDQHLVQVGSNIILNFAYFESVHFMPTGALSKWHIACGVVVHVGKIYAL